MSVTNIAGEEFKVHSSTTYSSFLNQELRYQYSLEGLYEFNELWLWRTPTKTATPFHIHSFFLFCFEIMKYAKDANRRLISSDS